MGTIGPQGAPIVPHICARLTDRALIPLESSRIIVAATPGRVVVGEMLNNGISLLTRASVAPAELGFTIATIHATASRTLRTRPFIWRIPLSGLEWTGAVRGCARLMVPGQNCSSSPTTTRVFETQFEP